MKMQASLLVILLSFFLVSCEPEPASNGRFRNTTNPDALRPLLFKPSDLDWTVGTYREGITDLSAGSDQVPFEDQMGAGLKIHPTTFKTKTPNILGCSQTVFSHADEATALRSIEYETERFSMGIGSLPEGFNFEVKLNRVIVGCRDASGSEIGSYLSCQLMAQHGRYLTIAHMVVDGQVIQFKDWEDMLNAIQDRMIAQVEQQSSE